MGGRRGLEGEVESSCLPRGILGGRGKVEGLEIPQTYHFESFKSGRILALPPYLCMTTNI